MRCGLTVPMPEQVRLRQSLPDQRTIRAVSSTPTAYVYGERFAALYRISIVELNWPSQG
jgi:hypothetical protein